MIINLDLAIKLPDGRMIDMPHFEWVLHQLRWRWLMDSYEGGEAYRTAIYGRDMRGLPIRNLVRHKREYPDPRQFPLNTSILINRPQGSDQYGAAGDNDDYQLRLARTPIPMFLAEVLETHLSKIYAGEVDRDTSDQGIESWWTDVDGCGTTVDRWMADTVAPFLLALGQIDIIFDHPATAEEVQTKADVSRLGLDKCIAGYILPDNMVWWKLDRRGRYVECLVREITDYDWGFEDRRRDGDSTQTEVTYRYWNAKGWWLYDKDSKLIKQADHPFGQVPIVRLFDRRRPRTMHVGLPRYETIAELQREYYNRDSELILSDTLHAHPLIQGPEDYVQADGTLPLGPGWLLPMKKDSSGGGATYQGFEVVEFPKEGAKSLQENLDRIRDRVDRAACLTKPAGTSGTNANSVSQSGTSKRMDQDSGNRLLGKIAGVLRQAETTMIEFVSIVLGNGTVNQAAIDGTTISYPSEFDLVGADEFAQDIAEFQALISSAGNLPETEEQLLCRLVRMMLPGLADEEYSEFDTEIQAFLAGKATEREQMREAGIAASTPSPEAPDAGSDPASDDTADPAGDKPAS